MTQLTNYGENQFADFLRGQGMLLPASWWIAPLSAVDDASPTEIVGLGLVRDEVACSLAAWAGTQGDGTTLASTGTSHATSNNATIDLGTASGSTVIRGLGFFDASSGGNCWAIWRPTSPIVVAASDPVTFAAGLVKFRLGLAGGMTDYLANKLIDKVFRGQSYNFPASQWLTLFTTAPTNAGGGTEVGGGVGYARAELVSSAAAISATDGPGTTNTTSAGTAGEISNNADVSHPQPSGSWGTCTHGGTKDASTGGNLLFWRQLDAPASISAATPPPTYPAGSIRFTFS